jgi:tRNA (Thr-GGU) A37 N-methylase
VLFWCHHARGFRSAGVPPRDVAEARASSRPGRRSGRTRSGCRACALLRIEKRVLHIADHDLLDGTPVLDLKPYLPYCDSVPDARIGYVADLAAGAADHRSWWQEKGSCRAKPRVADRDRSTGPEDDQLR